MQKFIHETSVSKEVFEKVTSEREENGEKIQITKDVKSVKPIKVAVLKPDRKKYKEAEIFYAKTLSVYLKEGLMPHSLVSKRFMNDGGPLTEAEKTALDTMRSRYSALQTEYFGMETPLSSENTKRRAEIMVEMNEINRIVKEIQNGYSEIFENTAEAKARKDTVEWWIINLSMIDEEGKGYVPLYGDGDYAAKTNKLGELEDKDDPFTNEVIKKLSFLVSFWSSSGPNASPQDFKDAELSYDRSISDYLKQEAELPTTV